jgi:beta-mannanase
MSSGSVPLRDIAAGNYDSSLKTWAQQAAAFGRPFFLRWNWEMNGRWFSWGTTATNQNTPTDYINSWRRFHDIANAAGATNITWVWCPNVDPANAFVPYSQLYPGDAYVDWTCLDGFNQTGDQTFNWLYGSSYQKLLQVAPSKPIMIGETSSIEEGTNKAAWTTDALTTQLPKNFPRIEALVWFNWRINEKGKWWTFPIESSSAAQSAFRTALASAYYKAGGGFGGLPLRSKIQPLP